jgi:hypothetical protein
VLLLQFLHHHLRVEDGGMRLVRRSVPHAIQVDTRKRAAVVSVDDTVGVQHRNDFKHEVASQLYRLRVVCVQQQAQ